MLSPRSDKPQEAPDAHPASATSHHPRSPGGTAFPAFAHTGADTQHVDEPARDGSFVSLLLNEALDPLFWPAARQGSASAWSGHIPFAHWLVAATRPRLLVELGTHTGVSYSAFCEAAVAAGTGTRCFAVDTWQGDAHAGFYDERVYADFKQFHDRHYGGFSTLLRMTFDEAAPAFAAHSIDLLHIDGMHGWDAVSHDFAMWLPKLSERGVVIFHDTNERREGFGVWRLWAELRDQYPSFEFLHSHGLGVLCVGTDLPEALAAFCTSSMEEVAAIRARFCHLGERWEVERRERAEKGQAIARSRHAEQEKAQALSDAKDIAESDRRDAVAAVRQEAEAKISNMIERWRAERDALKQAVRDADQEIAATKQELREVRAEGAAIIASVSWRVARPVRAIENLTQSFRERRRIRRLRRIIGKSGLFDREWYLAQYPDVSSAGIDPLLHYIRHGASEGRNPSDLFDPDWYLAAYPDVKTVGENPLAHYLKHGVVEGRLPRMPPVRSDSSTAELKPLTRQPAKLARGSWVESSAWESIPVPFSPRAGKKRIVVYTACAGDYDEVKPPTTISGDVDFVCFTDRAIAAAPIWSFKAFDYFDVDPTRMCRFVKLHPHVYFHDYEFSVWVDANVVIKMDIEGLVESVMRDRDIVLWQHYLRDCIYEEAEQCVRDARDDPKIIDAQMRRLRARGYPINAGLAETNVLITRPNDPRIIDFMTSWWREIDNGSRRDQLSFNWVLHGRSLRIGYLGEKGESTRNHPSWELHKHNKIARYPG